MPAGQVPAYTRGMADLHLPFQPPVEPMLAKASDGLPTDDGWLFEPVDGEGQAPHDRADAAARDDRLRTQFHTGVSGG